MLLLMAGYVASSSDDDEFVIEALQELGVDVFEPESRREELMAQTLEAFASFLLDQQPEMTEAILAKYSGSSVGELQGGSEEHSIYRVLITENPNDVAAELLREFHSAHPRFLHNNNNLTAEKLQNYMLSMCNRRVDGRKYSKLGNFMFIMSFGAAQGQVRHIDHMDPNLQVCLYMSNKCPSTIVYAMEGAPITNCQELIDYWETNIDAVPEVIRDVLTDCGDTALSSKPRTKYFSFWRSINAHLFNFGKVYQNVGTELALKACDPGTTLIAGGNQVHAGPPTNGPRMFAFAIAIPDENDETEQEEDNDGEIQYNPVLLHLDLCCILFGLIDFDYKLRWNDRRVLEAKHFPLNMLIPFIREYPRETYTRLIGDDRSDLRAWLQKLVESVENPEVIESLVDEAVRSDTLCYSPDVGRKRAKKKRKGKPRDRKNGL